MDGFLYCTHTSSKYGNSALDRLEKLILLKDLSLDK